MRGTLVIGVPIYDYCNSAGVLRLWKTSSPCWACSKKYGINGLCCFNRLSPPLTHHAGGSRAVVAEGFQGEGWKRPGQLARGGLEGTRWKSRLNEKDKGTREQRRPVCQKKAIFCFLLLPFPCCWSPGAARGTTQGAAALSWSHKLSATMSWRVIILPNEITSQALLPGFCISRV